MIKKFAAFALSGILAATSLAPTQAQARNTNLSQEEVISGLIFGALALYAISETAKNNKGKAQSKPKAKPKPKPKPIPHPKPPRKIKPKPPAYSMHLPAKCGRSTLPGHKPSWFFGRKCLAKNYVGFHRMPDRCFRQFETRRGTRVGLGPRCLRRAGYTW